MEPCIGLQDMLLLRMKTPLLQLPTYAECPTSNITHTKQSYPIHNEDNESHTKSNSDVSKHVLCGTLGIRTSGQYN